MRKWLLIFFKHKKKSLVFSLSRVGDLSFSVFIKHRLIYSEDVIQLKKLSCLKMKQFVKRFFLKEWKEIKKKIFRHFGLPNTHTYTHIN